MLDDTDLRILRELQRDARQPVAEIGRRVDLAASAVYERLRKLEDARVIVGYDVRLDPGRLQRSLLAFVNVRTCERPNSSRTAEALSSIPDVLEVHHIAGEDCYLVKVRTADAESLGRLLRIEFGQIPDLVATRTTIVFQTIKETIDIPLPEAASGGARRGT